MDIKTDPFNYNPLIQKDCIPEDILSSISTIMKSPLAYEFKTTCLKPFVDGNVIERIARIIKGARLYVLQKFHNTGVLHPEFFQGKDYELDDEELLHFKSLVEPWVEQCIVR
jgi:pyruvate formate lyase activating enzyme